MSSVRQRRGGGLPPDEGGASPGTVTSDEADDAATASLPVRVARQCWGQLVVLKYRYDLHTALYMLDPWERALFNTVLIFILAWSARLAAASFFGSGHGAASQ